MLSSSSISSVSSESSTSSFFFSPCPEGYTIYTKSNCKYCTYTKDLLNNKNIEYAVINCDEYLTSDLLKKEFLDFINLRIEKYSINYYNTFPMIFLDGKFIGGYTEIKKYLYNLEKEKEKREKELDIFINCVF